MDFDGFEWIYVPAERPLIHISRWNSVKSQCMKIDLMLIIIWWKCSSLCCILKWFFLSYFPGAKHWIQIKWLFRQWTWKSQSYRYNKHNNHFHLLNFFFSPETAHFIIRFRIFIWTTCNTGFVCVSVCVGQVKRVIDISYFVLMDRGDLLLKNVIYWIPKIPRVC